MITAVWTTDRTTQPQIGWSVARFQKNNGHARIRPYARHHDLPGKNVCSIQPFSQPFASSHGSRICGRRKSGMTWIAMSAYVCSRTYGVFLRRIRRSPKITTHSEYASV